MCNAEDLHAMVVGCLPSVESILAHLLGYFQFRQRFLGQFIATLIGFQPYPMRHVTACQLCTVLCIGHHANAFAREPFLAHIRSPSERIALGESIVNNRHQFVNGDIVHLIHTPVVGHLKGKALIERMVGVTGYADVVFLLQPEFVGKTARRIGLTVIGKLFGTLAQIRIVDSLQSLTPYGSQFLEFAIG